MPRALEQRPRNNESGREREERLFCRTNSVSLELISGKQHQKNELRWPCIYSSFVNLERLCLWLYRPTLPEVLPCPHFYLIRCITDNGETELIGNNITRKPVSSINLVNFKRRIQVYKHTQAVLSIDYYEHGSYAKLTGGNFSK